MKGEKEEEKEKVNGGEEEEIEGRGGEKEESIVDE